MCVISISNIEGMYKCKGSFKSGRKIFKENVDFQINDTGEGKDKQLSCNNINLVCRVNVINMVYLLRFAYSHLHFAHL